MKYFNSFTAMQKATSPLAFKPVSGDLEGYSLLLAVERSASDDTLSLFLNLFTGCHLTSDGKHDADAAVKLVKVYDEDGHFEKDPSDQRFMYGVYLRDNLPVWIKQLLIEAEVTFGFMNSETSHILPLEIKTEEHFQNWLGETPITPAFENDVIFAAIDRAMLAPNLKMFSGSWELPDNILLMYRIADIDKEQVVVEPRNFLMQLLPYRYRISMSDFKNEVLERNISLIALVYQE